MWPRDITSHKIAVNGQTMGRETDRRMDEQKTRCFSPATVGIGGRTTPMYATDKQKYGQPMQANNTASLTATVTRTSWFLHKLHSIVHADHL